MQSKTRDRKEREKEMEQREPKHGKKEQSRKKA
jgi:hypothetical protein